MTLSLNPSQPVRLKYRITDSQGTSYSPGIYNPGELPSEFINSGYCVNVTTVDGVDTPVVAQTIKFTESFLIKTWNNTICSSPFTGSPYDENDPRWSDEIDFGDVIRGVYIYIDDLSIKNATNQGNLYLEIYALIDGDIRKVFNGTFSNGDRGVTMPFTFFSKPFTKCRFFVDWIQLQPLNISNVFIAEQSHLKNVNGTQSSNNWKFPIRVGFDLSRQGNTAHPPIHGAMGSFIDYNHSDNSVTYDWSGYTLSPGQKIKIWGTPGVNAIPPLGISYLCEARTINRADDTLIIRGAIAPILGKLLRIRLLSGNLAGLSNGALVTFTESTQLTSNTWRVKLASSSGARLRITDTGSNRWIYFSYLDSPDLTLLSGNKLSLDGTSELDLFMEVDNLPATITAGTPSVITWTAHGLSPGTRITLGISSPAGSLPGNVNTQNNVVFVHSVVNANSFRVCAVPNTSPVCLGTSGSGATATLDNGTVTPITVAASTNSQISIALHGLNTNARFKLGGGLPDGYTSGDSLYVQAVTGNNITPSSLIGGLPVAFLSAGTNVTATGTNTTIDYCPIALNEYWLTAGSSSGEFDLRPTQNGTPFSIATATSTALTLEVLDPPTIESGKAVVFGFI